MRELTKNEISTFDHYGLRKKVIATINIDGLTDIRHGMIETIPYEIIIANVEFIPDEKNSNEAGGDGKSMAREILLKNKLTGCVQERICVTQCFEDKLFEFVGRCMYDVYAHSTLATFHEE